MSELKVRQQQTCDGGFYAQRGIQNWWISQSSQSSLTIVKKITNRMQCITVFYIPYLVYLLFTPGHHSRVAINSGFAVIKAGMCTCYFGAGLTRGRSTCERHNSHKLIRSMKLLHIQLGSQYLRAHLLVKPEWEHHGTWRELTADKLKICL